MYPQWHPGLLLPLASQPLSCCLLFQHQSSRKSMLPRNSAGTRTTIPAQKSTASMAATLLLSKTSRSMFPCCRLTVRQLHHLQCSSHKRRSRSVLPQRMYEHAAHSVTVPMRSKILYPRGTPGGTRSPQSLMRENWTSTTRNQRGGSFSARA